jgi:NAD(P)-dependent dehydrogenase (short-subunit alcohol dehydrogenase family)
MTIATGTSPNHPEPGLLEQTAVVIGGSSGIGLETARRARSEGAKLILAARDPERLENASRELGTLSTAAFDATNFDQLKKFFNGLPTPIDHVLVTGPGPYYAPLADLDVEKARRDVDAHLFLPMQVARFAAKKVRLEGRCSSWAERAVAGPPRGHSSLHLPPRCQRSPRRSRSRWLRSG